MTNETVPISTDVEIAVTRLRSGGLVALPTETVYGLAADLERPDAIARIYDVKGRPEGHPLIVHVASAEEVSRWAKLDDAASQRLASNCWPGPLTLLLPKRSSVPEIVTGGRTTVGIRVPAHPLALALLNAHGGAVAAPSANRFGHVSPTTVDHVVRDLGTRLDPKRDLILDGGPSAIGVESTIVDMTCDPPQVLRPGGIAPDDINELLGMSTASASGPSRAAGMMASHYAPRTPVLLVERNEDIGERVGHRTVFIIDRTTNLVESAHHLYDDLRRADDAGVDCIVAVLPPAEGLGYAIRDRLMKAAADTPRHLHD